MRDRLTGEAEVKTAGGEIVDRHDREQRRNDADEVKILHKEHVADASCEAHAALLRERADDERRDQRKDNGRMLAAGAFGAHSVNAGRRADDEQSGEQDRQDCAAKQLRLIGAAEREALFEEERAGRNAARKADERDPCVQIACGHTQHHAERTAEEHEGADHHRSAQNKTHHRRRTGGGLVFLRQQGEQERAADKADDLRAEILYGRGRVQLERAGAVADEAGHADSHIRRVAVDRQQRDQQTGHRAGQRELPCLVKEFHVFLLLLCFYI